MDTDRPAGARRIKADRATALASLRQTTSTLQEVLQDTPETLQNVSIHEVLLHCPAIGRSKTERALQCANVWPFRLVGQLTTHELEAILRELPD